MRCIDSLWRVIRAFFFLISISCVVPAPGAPDGPKSTDQDRRSEFRRVLRCDDMHGLRNLLQRGSSVNLQDEHGNTPLMDAALYSKAITVKLLLEQGADPNMTNRDGATVLMRAAGSFDTIRLLLNHGANVNARSALGNTPLLLAARPYGSSSSVKLL